MKLIKLFFILLIINVGLQSSTKADDISEFEIEGISIGDSALKYFSKKTLNKNKKDWFKDKEYSISTGLETSSMEKFDKLQFIYLTNDLDYKLVGIEAVKFYEDNISECNKIFDQTFLELKELFSEVTFSKKNEWEHEADEVGTTMVTGQSIQFPNGDAVELFCENWSKESGFSDGLRISLRKNSYIDFLRWRAY